MSARFIQTLGILISLSLSSLVAGQDVTSPRLTSVDGFFPYPGSAVGLGGVHRVEMSFDEPVSLLPGALTVWSQRSGVLRNISVTPAVASVEKTLTFPKAVNADRLLIVMDGLAVLDGAGNPLDGEVISLPEPVLPSGDGLPGGMAVVELVVLTGDVDEDSDVDGDDLAAIRGRLGLCTGDPDFLLAADLDGDGCIEREDFLYAEDLVGATLPAGDGTPPAVIDRTPPPGAVFRGGVVDTVRISMTKRLRSELLSGANLTVVQPDGTVRNASTGFVQAADLQIGETTLVFEFTPPIDAPGQHRFQLGSGLVDNSGERLDPQTSLTWEVLLDDSPAHIAASSPVHQESGVALTRETIIEFNHPVDLASFDPAAFYAVFAGQDIPALVHLSADLRKVTLFYDDPLPPSALVRVHVDGDLLLDDLGNLVDGDGDGVPGGVGFIDFETLTITTLPGTRVCGRIFASELDGAMNVPLEGVTVSVDGAADTLFALTDVLGNFALDPAPVGRFFVHIDGSTATNASIPPGDYYPTVGKPFKSVAGQETLVGDIYLPRVIEGTLQVTSNTQDTTIGFPMEVVQTNPDFEGVSITVPGGSLFANDGTVGGMVGIAPVDPDRLPGQLPPQLGMPLVITVQTDGLMPSDMNPTNFDVPAPVVFPNLPDPSTGETLAPGDKTSLMSFDHDRGKWHVVGSMTISEDGLYAVSDPGVGILAPGWHGAFPGPPPPPPCPEESCTSFGSPDCVGPAALGILDCAASFIPMATAANCAFAAASAGIQVAVGCHNGLSVSCLSDAAFGAVGVATCAVKSIPILGSAISCGGALATIIDSCTCLADPSDFGPTPEQELAGLYTALLGATEAYYVAILGSPVWTNAVDPTEFGVDPFLASEQVGAIITTLGGALDEGSPAGELIDADEATALLSLPRPATILESDVLDLIDHFNLTVEMWGNGIGTHAEAGQDGFIDVDQATAALQAMQSVWETIQNDTEFDTINLIGTMGDLFEALFEQLRKEGDNDGDYSRTFSILINETSGDVRRSNLTGEGDYDTPVVATNSFFRSRFYDPTIGYFGGNAFRTGGPADSIAAAPVIIISMDDEPSYPDTDEDGLKDFAEDVIGTDVNNPDTDGDGITDGAEVAQGTDPLSGQPVQAGIIDTADTPGNAIDICAEDDVVIVADSSEGISVFNVFNGMSPTIVAQVPTSNAVAVACSGLLVAVADGSGGAKVIDVTDPPNAAVIHSVGALALGGSANGVAAAGPTAYFATGGGEVVAMDLASGAILDRLYLGMAVVDVVVDGPWLYALTATSLYTVDVSELPMVLGGSASAPGITNAWRRRVFAGGGVAYAIHRQGYRVYDVSDPVSPVLIDPIDGGSTAQLGWKHIVPNGSGLGVAAVGNNATIGGPHEVFLYDLSDPLNPDLSIDDRFLGAFVTPGVAQAVAIYNGLAYVADRDNGLQVLNYVAYDALGVPPTVDFTTDIVGQFVDGATFRLDVQVTDDVQVRNVELFLNGTSVGTDGGFPFQFVETAAPEVLDGDMIVTVVASDTGGNTATLTEAFTVVPDTTPPTVQSASPDEAEEVPEPLVEIDGFRVFFSESLDPTTVHAGSVLVTWAGPDDTFDTGDDAPVVVDIALEELDRRLLVGIPSPPVGMLRLTLDGSLIADPSGNLFDGDGNGTPEGDYQRVLVCTPAPDTRVWVSDTSGLWQDPANWNDGILPVATDLVIISRPNLITVTVSSGNQQCDRVYCDENLNLSGGSLEVSGELQVNRLLRLIGGDLINATVVPGNSGYVVSATGNSDIEGVTLNAPLVHGGGNLRIWDSLELNDTFTIINGSITEFFGAGQVVSGAGTVILTNGTLRADAASYDVVIGPDITVRAGQGTLGNQSAPLTIQGTVISETSNALYLYGSPLILEGSVEATAGTVILSGDWTNTGSIEITPPAQLNLDGDFTPSDLGSITTAGAVVRIRGDLDLEGGDLTLDASLGSWWMVSCDILNGTLDNLDGTSFRLGQQANLHGITLDGAITPGSNNPILRIYDGLVVNGTVSLAGGADMLFQQSADHMLSGTGEVVFVSSPVILRPLAGSLTVGPDVTIRGDGGSIGHPSFPLTLQGNILAEGVNVTTIFGSPWVNEGSIECTGGVVTLQGDWTNLGTVTATSPGWVRLDGTYTVADIGNVDGNGGPVFLRGLFDNTGTTFTLSDATGSWGMDGVDILGGTLDTQDGQNFIFSTNSTLDGVTIAGSMIKSSNPGHAITVLNDITIDGSLTLNSAGGLFFPGPDPQSLLGSGVVIFGDLSDGNSVRPTNGGNLTIGPGITVSGVRGNVGDVTLPMTVEGVVEVDGTGIITVRGTDVTLTGTLSVSAVSLVQAALTNSGLFRMEAASQVSGSEPFTQTAAGVMEVTISGTAANQWPSLELFSDPASIDGTLDIITDGYTPTLGDTFDVIISTALTGTYSTVTGTDLGGGLFFDVQYLAGRVRLVVSN